VLSATDGRRVQFEMTVTGGDDVVARGRHRREVVDRERFLARLALS
jgi:fluoroacetyl-CoA thioesterase